MSNIEEKKLHEQEEHEHGHHHHGEEECSCGCGHDHSHEEHEHEHHHDEESDCCCGHDHDHEVEECGCGHDHEHEEDDDCCCGHNHDHDDDDECDCGCGHEHEHEHEHHHHTHADSANGKKAVFILENLGCAHCASKMEEKIQALPQVAEATIVFATKQLRLVAEDPQALLPEIQKICASVESQVKVISKETATGCKTVVYLVENLGCAHCASKMEEQIARLDGIEAATLTFATKQLRVTAKNSDQYLSEIQKICSSIESEVKVVKRESAYDVKIQEKSAEGAVKLAEKDETSKEKKELLSIVAGAILFVAGILLEHTGASELAILGVLAIGYLILGGKVLLEAARNISHGQIFDENFLMCVATLGAFAIQEYPEAVGVMLFYRIGDYFEERAVERSRGQIMEAVDLRPETVNLSIGEEVRVIPAAEAHVGDVLLIRPGDRIPLDGMIIEGESRLDTSPITGEPVPVSVSAGDSITSGCVNTSGQLKIKVEKPLEESMVTKILDSVENAAASKPKIDRFITRFSKVYTPTVVFLALAVAVIPSLVSGNWNYWVYTALSFLVMSCPCALVLSVPLAFFSGIGAGSRKGILFKGGVSIEALGNLKAVIMDKTGTVTEGNFQLQKAESYGNYREEELLRICASCEQNSTHPIAHSIVNAAKEQDLLLDTPTELKEIAGHGIEAVLPEGKVLCGNHKLMEANGIEIPDLSGSVYGAEVFLAINGRFAGYLVISDTVKADAKTAIQRLKSQGLHTVMLTGDSKASAEGVAKETGIDEVYAKLLPQDKLEILQRVRAERGTVMFVGDGINDAPVLAGADVGAAMGSGADAAIEAADAVFMTSSVESIPESISIARQTNGIAVQNVVFALTIKAIVMILGLIGFANMWLAVFADTGVAMLCVLNSIRILYKR